MLFLGKSVSDEEWLARAQRLYNNALPPIMAVSNAVLSGSIEEIIEAIWDRYNRIIFMAREIGRLPRPTSSAARLADKQLKSAMKRYADGVKDGLLFIYDLYKGAGTALGEGGTAANLAAGRLATERDSFEGLIKSGQKAMKQADAYFSNRAG